MPALTARSPLLLLAACLLTIAGCAALPPGKRAPRDPWERLNRTTYRFNDKLDRAVARPVARTYRRTPQFLQTGVHNFFDNIDTPVVMLNDLLQGQLRPFVSDTGRLLLNTTLGIGGLFDPATAAGLAKNDRDFGQTLGKWGVKSGPYLVLPFLGPSDVRDTAGKMVDTLSTPRTYIRNTYWDYGTYLLEKVDARSRLLGTDQALDSAYDPYAFMRNAYLQYRDFKVSGGSAESEEERREKLLEQEAEDESAAPEAQPPAGTPPASSPDKSH